MDWDLFMPRRGPATPARPIDLQLSPDLNRLANQKPDAIHGLLAKRLADRNLLRGYYRRMPFGQVIADALGVPRLTPQQILAEAARQADTVDVVKANGFHEQTPAWYYFLCEAAICHGGARLGAAASKIVASTILGFVRAHGLIYDRDSGKQTWTPELSALKVDGAPLTDFRDIVDFVAKAPA